MGETHDYGFSVEYGVSLPLKDPVKRAKWLDALMVFLRSDEVSMIIHATKESDANKIAHSYSMYRHNNGLEYVVIRQGNDVYVVKPAMRFEK